MKSAPDQLSLPLFDTTALTSSMGLYSGLSFGEPIDDSISETEEDAPAPVLVPARNFRLADARRLSPDWKTRAADNIAAMRLMLEIEEEARNATPDEQERLALFTSFGAGDLANNLFRRSPDEVFPKGWETLGGSSKSSSRRPNSQASPASLNMRISRLNSLSASSGAH